MRQKLIVSITFVIGIFLGWLFFHSSPIEVATFEYSSEASGVKIWTCAMHTQIRIDKRGRCPICGMALIPIGHLGSSSPDPEALLMSREAIQLANVQTTIVSMQNPTKEIRLSGKVLADERLLQNQVAFFSGRIEKLLINFTGEAVRKGQPLILIYSPELITAQQEFLEAVKSRQVQPEIYAATYEKLLQWKLTNKQIAALESSGIIKSAIEVESTTQGVVTARRVNTGDYVNQGTVLFEVTDLSSVWVNLDAYESDLPFLKKGDSVEFKVQAIPGSTYRGLVNFIDPYLDPVNRVAKVRVEISNSGGLLKPEMFVAGLVRTGVEKFRNKLVIPRSAVLWGGKRSVVYLKLSNKTDAVYKVREVELGLSLGDSYIVESGLKAGDEVVTQGAFSVDAAAQLEGLPSMMNLKISNPSPLKP